jgi:cytochrome c5
MGVAAFAAGQAPQLPDGEGKTLLNAQCAGCHGLDVLAGKQSSKEEWKGTVDRMVSYGASLNDKQQATLIDYLAANLGPKTASNDDAMKKLTEAACGSCHGLDLITGRTGTKMEWQEVVERMVSRGASVADKDVTPMVEYLAKTYPNK